MTGKQNIFVEQPEFANNDPRVNRPSVAGYNTHPAFMQVRHELLLPSEIIRNKTVLDLGSCNAASGAWCLSKGAASYRGVEYQEPFVKSSSELLTKYYPQKKWEIIQSSIEDYLRSRTDDFDIVLASGVLYAFSDVIGILTAMAGIANALVIESRHPQTLWKTAFLSAAMKKTLIQSKHYIEFIENEPFISLGREAMVMPGEQTMYFKGTRPSMGAIKYVMQNLDFQYVDAMNLALKRRIPEWYSPFERFGLFFVRADSTTAQELGFIPAATGKAKPIGFYSWGNGT
jgi:predicted nicotinamide N-methyase